MDQLKTTIINYCDGIYAIDQQMVRAFLIVSKTKALLLDTGAVRTDIITRIKEITSLPVDVILTHADGDHTGNLQDFSSAFINENDMPAVLANETYKDVSLLPVNEGDVFDIGDRKLRVIFTPGHTAGSVCLLDEENKILFAGDTVSYGPVFMSGEGRNIDDYLVSLKRLELMKDDGKYNTIYCCHNTCPLPAQTVSDMIKCVQGIQDKMITGFKVDIPLVTNGVPYIYKYGKCAILLEENKNGSGQTNSEKG
ncbi:MAG: MBL fold metallo-hydrolase [Oscillospiraceae bacterium]|nr:MBL fold metallo-hydrolase [Oscillospiraceae bacterium]